MNTTKRCRHCIHFVYDPHMITSVMTGDVVAQFDGFCNSSFNCKADCPRGPSVFATDKCIHFEYNGVYKKLTDYKRVF